jgi:hypothetical protein
MVNRGHRQREGIEPQNIEQGMSNVEVAKAGGAFLRHSAVPLFDILRFAL